MRIDRDQVARLARLSALDLADGEDALLAAELTRLLEHFETLRSLPEEALPPLAASRRAPLREDGPPDGSAARPFVAANAPRVAHGHFVVPRVVPRPG